MTDNFDKVTNLQSDNTYDINDLLNSINIDKSYTDKISSNDSATTISDSTISDTITINGGSLSSSNSGYWTTTNPYTIGTSGNWEYVDTISTKLDGYLSREETETQLNILEKYFKMGLVNSNNYDRKLNKVEFLDLLKLYINKTTNRECTVDFNKDMMLEEITFRFDSSTSFTLDNNNDLQPETYIFFRDTFYVNTENLLAIIKKATFNRLLNV